MNHNCVGQDNRDQKCLYRVQHEVIVCSKRSDVAEREFHYV